MKFKVFYWLLGSIAIILSFQNCAGVNTTFQSQDEILNSIQHIQDTAFLSSEGSSDDNSDGRVVQGEDDNQNNVTNLDCEPNILRWEVNGKACEASYAKIAVNQNSELFDNTGSVTGKASVKCVNKEIQIDAKTCDRKVADSDTGTKLKARMFKNQYLITDAKAFAYTGVTVKESVYVCMQSGDDSSYPCINGVNGDLTKTFKEVPRPSQPSSDAQELIWESKNFFEISQFKFGTYEVYFVKKDSQGRLRDRVGSVKFRIALPSEVLYPGLSGSYSGRNRTISYACPVNSEDSVPGYLRYDLSNQNCYYKVK